MIKDNLRGNVEVIPNCIDKNKYSTFILRYTVGKKGIAIGGGIKIGFEWGDPLGCKIGQDYNLLRPKDDNFISVKCISKNGGRVTIGKGMRVVVNPTIIIHVKDNPLIENDVIEITFGDVSKGSKGYRIPNYSRVTHIIFVIDTDGNKVFNRLSDKKLPEGYPKFTIKPGKIEKLQVLAKSQVTVGTPLKVLVRAVDEENNVINTYQSNFSVYLFPKNDESNTILECTVTKEENGVKIIPNLIFYEEGIKRIFVKDEILNLEAVSNPFKVNVRDDLNNKNNVYWGQIHDHTLFSDGIGLPDEFYNYAKNLSNLDFAALSDHGTWVEMRKTFNKPKVRDFLRQSLLEEDIEILEHSARKFNHPGEFLTFLGYEWCKTIGGDINVYFYKEENDISLVLKSLDTNSPKTLFKFLRENQSDLKSMAITHFMLGKAIRTVDVDKMDTNYEDPAHLEHVVEICSVHGVREYGGDKMGWDCDNGNHKYLTEGINMVQDALARGYKLGLIGGSDSHLCSPGTAVKGMLSCPIEGLMAAKIKKLNREDLWNSFINRTCYATTGARILIDEFSINDHRMGEIVNSEINHLRKIKVRVFGTDKIKKVLIIKNFFGLCPNRKCSFYRKKKIEGTVKCPNCGTRLHIKSKIFYEKDYDSYDVEFELIDKNKELETDYYFIRVMQIDKHIAWSSPIWIS